MLDSKIEKVKLHFGIAKMSDWGDVFPYWITQVHGVGQATLDHIRLYLASHGQTLKDDKTAEYWMNNLGKAKICQQMSEDDKFVVSPFTVIVDTREQAPWRFEGLSEVVRGRTDPDTGGPLSRPLIVPIKAAGLDSGDYSIEGFEDRIAIERKSLTDLYGTLGSGRERFERELARLNRLEFAAVVVEAGWPTILADPPAHSKMAPKSIYRSIIAYQQRFVRVHWWMCDSRTFAERTTFRILERFRQDELKPESPRQGVFVGVGEDGLPVDV